MFAAPQNQQNKPVELDHELSPRIAVIGVGGAGCNAVNNMVASKLEGVDFYALNTDSQSLKHSLAPNRVQLGTHATRGLGAGSKPDVGRAAAEETINDFMEQLGDVNMVFITAGMGGGTGTGAAPIIARACKEAGILTVGVVTKPFHFEGAHRMRTADKGIEEIQDLVDTLIVIPNQNLFRVANEKTTFSDSFRMADGVLQSGVRGITDLIVRPGMVNLDFADIRTAMVEWMGKAMMGTGEAEGDRRAIEAAERAINNPLLDDISMKGAKGVIINITCGYDMTLFEVDEAVNRIRDEVDADANIIFGTSFDDTMHGQMRVTLLATGIETQSMRKGQPTSHAAQPAMQRPPVPMTAELVVPKYNPQPATYATAQPNIVPPTVSRVGSAFIPPKPAEAHDMKHADEPHHMVPPAAVHDYHVAQDHLNLTFQETPVAAPAEVEPQRPSTLKLTPPTPGQAAHAAKQQAPKKKGMSLFDKFTSFFNQAEEEEAAEAARPAAAGRTAPNMGGTEYTAMPHAHQPSVSAPQFGGQQAVASANPFDADPFGVQQAGMGQTTVTQQGTVLAAKANEQAQKDKQPDYDIPAFLRRQMS